MTTMTANKKINWNNIREWISIVVLVLGVVVGSIFWIQKSGDDKYIQLEKEIQILQIDLKQMYDKNSEILRLIGTLEGKMEIKK